MSMCFGAAYNGLFLVYVALWSLSLWALVLSLMAFDVHTLPQRFGDRLPRRAIAGLLFVAGGFVLLAWLGRIVPPLLAGTTPPLENTTSLFIQAMDLALIVPAAFVGGVLLLRYLLAPVLITKMITMGLAVSLMSINMARVGVTISLAELIVFPVLTAINLLLAGLLLKNITARPRAPRVA
jgi:hypothetical protein